jgi:hypothetical protein
MGRGTSRARRTRALTAAGLVAAIAATGASRGPAATSGTGPPVSVSTSISPRAIFFGDRLTAVLDARVRPEAVDPRSVSIAASFAPFTTLGRPVLERDGDSIHLRARLVCLNAACTPETRERRVLLVPAEVRYREHGHAATMSGEWPAVLVASRLTAGDLEQLVVRSRLQPPAEKRTDRTPGWLLTGLGVLLFLAAGALLAGRLFARPVAADQVEPTELDRALSEVERLGTEIDDARRSAIDRLASALAGAGLDEEAAQARALAWSKQPPATDSMRRLLELVGRLIRRAA